MSIPSVTNFDLPDQRKNGFGNTSSLLGQSASYIRNVGGLIGLAVIGMVMLILSAVTLITRVKSSLARQSRE